MEATKMSIDRCMDKEVVEHIHNGILLSPQKDQTQVSFTEVDESRAFDTDWTKSERDKQISYTSAYIYGILGNGTGELFCKAEIDTQMQRKDLSA